MQPDEHLCARRELPSFDLGELPLRNAKLRRKVVLALGSPKFSDAFADGDKVSLCF